jgi:hypothetical protein
MSLGAYDFGVSGHIVTRALTATKIVIVQEFDRSSKSNEEH